MSTPQMHISPLLRAADDVGVAGGVAVVPGAVHSMVADDEHLYLLCAQGRQLRSRRICNAFDVVEFHLLTRNVRVLQADIDRRYRIRAAIGGELVLSRCRKTANGGYASNLRLARADAPLVELDFLLGADVVQRADDALFTGWAQLDPLGNRLRLSVVDGALRVEEEDETTALTSSERRAKLRNAYATMQTAAYDVHKWFEHFSPQRLDAVCDAVYGGFGVIAQPLVHHNSGNIYGVVDGRVLVLSGVFAPAQPWTPRRHALASPVQRAVLREILLCCAPSRRPPLLPKNVLYYLLAWCAESCASYDW